MTAIINANTAREDRHRQEKTDNENRNRHEKPRNGFEACGAESLEHTGSYNGNKTPVEHTHNTTGHKMIQKTGDTHQKNNGCGLAQFHFHST
jgi:hypothetical protein